WLLLGDAVNVPTAQQDLPPGYHYHPALGKQLFEKSLRHAVTGIIEGGRDDAAVDDQEVDIRAGKANRGLTRLAAGDLLHPSAFLLGGVDGTWNRHAVHRQ